MTRETKIGLLVGLAFIIVIGILLSDHLTSSTEPPPAPMSQAGSNLCSGVSTPARPQDSPVAQVMPAAVQPAEPVRTADDLTPRPQPVKIVQVTPPQQGETLTITSPGEPPAANALTAAPPESAAPAPVVLRQGTPAVRSADPVLARLNEEARRLGESVVPFGTPSGAPSTVSAARTYRAEPGDSLSKIATKMYGSGGRAYKDAIIEANPSLKTNPDLVIEGRSYQIPAMMKPVASIETAAVTPQQTGQPADSSATYVVLEGDNLTRIATEQCGTSAALAAIKELNRETLKGSDVIRPGMRLKLPARSVAVNN